MRTRNTSNNASFVSTDAGINSNSTLEFRATLAANNNGNQVQFYFHGGRITLGKFGYFGEFRPLPYQYEVKQGVKTLKVDDNNQPIVGNTWCQHVSLQKFELSAQESAMVAAIKAKPETKAVFLPMLSQEAIASLENNGVCYEEFDWTELLMSLFGHTSVKFNFTVPQQFVSLIEDIKETVKSKEQGQNYSLVLRFDLEDLRAQGELKSEHNSELLRKDVTIIPSYIGIIEGVTKVQMQKTGLINPENIAGALAKAKLAKANKVANPYLTTEYLASQAAKVQERLAYIGTGKKAHQPIVASIYEAAKVGDTVKVQEEIQLLTAIAERGANRQVDAAYVAIVQAKAQEQSQQEQKQEVTTITSSVIEESEEVFESLSEDALGDLFDD